MAIIEKKYLLNDSILTLVRDADIRKDNISQFYTQIEICKEIRFRKLNDTHFKTVRTGSDIRKNEIDKKISAAKYLKAKSDKIGCVLKKERFYLEGSSEAYSIDNYRRHLKNLLILEVHFKTEEEAEKFSPPEALKPYIKKDVSDDDRYRNKNLALLGNPLKQSYNIYAIFKDIEQERLHDTAHVIFPEMLVSDAIRIVLYKIYHAIKVDSQKLILENDIHALDRFRKNLKQAKIFLDEYKHIFDQTMYKKVRLHLAMVEKTIAIDKDLSVIRSNLKLLESAFDEKEVNRFIFRIDKRMEKEKHKVKHFFKTREFAIIMKQLELLIKEQSNVFSDYHSNENITTVIKSSVQKRFKKLLNLTKKYDKCHDIDSYKKMKKALHKSKTILDNFSHLYDEKTYVQMRESLNDTNNKLSDFINLNKRSLIIKTYIRNSDKELREQHQLIENVQKKRKSLEKMMNKKIDHSIEILREKRSLFKH